MGLWAPPGLTCIPEGGGAYKLTFKVVRNMTADRSLDAGLDAEKCMAPI